MSRVEVSELRDRDDKKVKDLAKFLESRVKAKIAIVSGEITINYEEEMEKILSKRYLRVLLRKFLHKAGLKERFRVISGKENVFIIKEKRRVEMEK